MLQEFAEGFEKLGYPPHDPVFSMRESILQIQRVMIMLENQIPLFILNWLLGLQLGDPNQKERVAKLAIQFFDPLMPKDRVFVNDCKRLEFDPLYDHGMVHCLEVIRRRCLQLGPKWSKTKRWSQSRERLTRCLTELREARIKITSSYSSLIGDIEFKDGILRIPWLFIHGGTRSFFLNLIAFEQSHLNCSHHVTLYVVSMHNSINSLEDARYRCDRKIIEHCLESDAQVFDLFCRLCHDVAFDIEDNFLFKMTRDQWLHWFGVSSFNPDDPILDNPYCFLLSMLVLSGSMLRAFLTRKWNAWVAILKNKHFDNPWSIISLIAAFILLVLTFMQTFYTVHAYHSPRSRS